MVNYNGTDEKKFAAFRDAEIEQHARDEVDETANVRESDDEKMRREKLSAVERLEALLDARDAEVARLGAELRRRDEADEDAAWSWARHYVSAEAEGLPVPRLEIRWSRIGGGEWNWLATYGLVYRHLLGHVVVVPLGMTRVGGAGEPLTDGQVDVPFREGAHALHDSLELGLPAFAVFEGRVRLVAPALGPLTASPAPQEESRPSESPSSQAAPESPWGNRAVLLWSGPGDDGAILHMSGESIESLLGPEGTYSCDDGAGSTALPLLGCPGMLLGISVWEGSLSDEVGTNDETEFVVQGSYRRPTPVELACIVEGTSPWGRRR
jgi:hypothetical protein